MREVCLFQPDMDCAVKAFFDDHLVSFVNCDLLRGFQLIPPGLELDRVVVMHFAL